MQCPKRGPLCSQNALFILKNKQGGFSFGKLRKSRVVPKKPKIYWDRFESRPKTKLSFCESNYTNSVFDTLLFSWLLQHGLFHVSIRNELPPDGIFRYNAYNLKYFLYKPIIQYNLLSNFGLTCWRNLKRECPFLSALTSLKTFKFCSRFPPSDILQPDLFRPFDIFSTLAKKKRWSRLKIGSFHACFQNKSLQKIDRFAKKSTIFQNLSEDSLEKNPRYGFSQCYS